MFALLTGDGRSFWRRVYPTREAALDAFRAAYDLAQVKADSHAGVHYHTDGTGRWWRRVTAPQCGHRILNVARCQGAAGHGGDHWAYRPDGWLWRAQSDGGADMAPPGHKAYPDPRTLHARCYTQLVTETEVTDPAELARLSGGRIRAGESSSGPLTAVTDPKLLRKVLDSLNENPHE